MNAEDKRRIQYAIDKLMLMQKYRRYDEFALKSAIQILKTTLKKKTRRRII